jgi:hypothetical protein
MFCEAGGLQVILDSIRDNECSDKADEFNLTILACLISAASLPALTYHKAVIADFGGQLVTEAKKKLLGAPDKALRDMRREAIDAITKAVDLFNKRIMKREDRKPALEGLKLDVCLLCLSSSFLQRRIQGISDLTTLIKNQRVYSTSTTEAGKALVKWIAENKVLELVFDPQKTHLQIVQRCDEIIKLLLAEDELTAERMQMFW